MKRFFQIIGLLSLMGFSFYYTEKTNYIVKELDNLMITIKEEKDKYYIEPVDAIIIDDYIIPGLSGREVDINTSYEVVKKVGKYSPNLLEYNKIKPTISIANNYDKYIISGNKNRRVVTLIFKVKDNDDITIIKNILDNYQVKASFFITSAWFNSNTIYISDLIKEDYNIGILDNNIWMNRIISRIGKQKISFCYTEIDNKDLLNNCIDSNSYTIKPNTIIKTNYLIEVKKNLENGSIIVFDDNNVIKELPLIIKYIKNKGYDIKNLVDFIEE